MNYKNIYDKIINRAKIRLIEGYTEKHHIIPRCMGGSDDDENLVRLTPEEHYVAHQLLVKMYPGNHKLIKAAAMMIPNRPSNKMYGWLRRRFSETQSLSQLGKNNSQHGTKWICNFDLEESKKISKNDVIPYGWVEGRVQDFSKFNVLCERYNASKEEVKELFDKNTRSFIRVENSLKHKQKTEEKIKKLRSMMYYYRDNNISMRDLTKKFNVGHNVYKSFERYFKDEYYEIVQQKSGNSNIAKGRYKGA